jgi:hypothetical protein
MRNNLIFGALLAVSTLAGCGGGGGSSGPATPGAGNLGPHLVSDIPINNWTATNAASFDLTYVDPVAHTASFTDRDNASVDQITNTGGVNTLTAIISTGAGTFAGCRAAGGAPTNCNSSNNGASGPNGLDGIGPAPAGSYASASSLIAGDVGQLGIVSSASKTITAIIPNVFSPVAGNTFTRNDEGCVLPANAPGNPLGFGLYAVASPSQGGGAADPVFYTFVNLNTNAVIGQVTLPSSSGQEACQFDLATGKMYYNDDGDLGAGLNPDGSLDSFAATPAFIAALTAAPVSVKNGQRFLSSVPAGSGLPGTSVPGHVRVSGYNTQAGFKCDPAGLALNETNNIDVAVNCRPTTAINSALLIINRNTGALVANVLAGNGDQLAFDRVSNRYYNASSRWTPNGISPNGCAATPASKVCTPRLNIVDATTFAVIARLPTGNNAHSVGVDGGAGFAYVPYSNATSPAGCGDCAVNGFINGGVSIFAIR